MARKSVTRGAPPKLARSSRPRTASKTTTRRKSTSGRSDETNLLGTYFREMSELSVMTPEEEKASATKIASLRTTYWEDIFSYPPYTDGVMDFLESEMKDKEGFPKAEVDGIRKLSRSLRDRETRAHKDAFFAAAKELSELVGYLDVDGIVSDKIVADLVSLRRGGKRARSLTLKPPREGSRPYADYVNRVRATERALKRAKDAFVKCNLRLVVSIARRFNHGRMPLQDLIQEGNIGLMKAVDRFDVRKGFRFSTYGSWWIRHAISRAVADKGRQVRLPVHMIDAYHKVARAKREFDLKHGRDATLEELAKSTGLPLVKIQKMNGLLLDQAVSLDKPVGGGDDGEGRRLVDFLKDDSGTSPGEQIATDAMNSEVKRLISRLRPIEEIGRASCRERV